MKSKKPPSAELLASLGLPTLEELSSPFEVGGPGRPRSITELSEEDRIAVRQGFASAAHLRAMNAAKVPNARTWTDGKTIVRTSGGGTIQPEESSRAEADSAKEKALGPYWAARTYSGPQGSGQ